MGQPASIRPNAHHLLPSTRGGRWAAGLMAGSLVMFSAFFLLVMSGQRGGDTFFSNLWLSSAILGAAALAIAGGVVGVVAAVRDRERSLLVGVAIVLGFLVSFFTVGEIAFPH